MKVEQKQQSKSVKAFVSPKAIAKRCGRCKKINLSCKCLQPSPLLNRKERSFVVATKSWLLGWMTDDDEDSSSEEESDAAEESFVFPEVDDRDRFKDATLVSDEEDEEDVHLQDLGFVQEEVVEMGSEKSGNELPSFFSLAEVLLSKVGN